VAGVRPASLDGYETNNKAWPRIEAREVVEEITDKTSDEAGGADSDRAL